MAITLVAASQVVINFEAAAAMVLGGNIGTTIIANLGAFVSNTEARRAALAHFIFNSIGVIWIIILFTPYLALADKIASEFMSASPLTISTDIPIGLSIFHSSFNIINTLVLIGFIHYIAKIVIYFIHEKPVPEPVFCTSKYLTKQSLNYPETAIKALLDETRRLYQEAVIEAIAHSLGVHRKDIMSDIPVRQIVEQHGHPGIKHKLFIKTRIQPIYTEVLDYASEIQEKFSLTKEDNDRVTRLKKVHRDALDVMSHVRILKKEMARHKDDNNPVLENEYI